MSAPVISDPWVTAILGEPTIGGRFTDLTALDKSHDGQFGYVFDALDASSGRRVVLKFLKPDLQLRWNAASLYFEREGQICEQLRGHPNIVSLAAPPGRHDIQATFQTGQAVVFPFMYLAFERGTRDFDSYLFAPRHRLPSLWRRLEIVRGVVKGVARLHALGYCHRDLKPDNIFLFVGGDARLGDLGLCRRLDDPVRLTSDYIQPIGHRLYAPPEAYCGAADVPELYKSADWFAVGAILFEALAGVRLYAAIGLQSPIDVTLEFVKHGPLQQYENIVGDIAGAHPIPTLDDFMPPTLLGRSSETTRETLDRLIRGLCHFDYRRRFSDGTRILRQLDIAISQARLDDRRFQRVRNRTHVGIMQTGAPIP